MDLNFPASNLEVRGDVASSPRCPNCGGVLEKRRFTDVWDMNDNPVEVYEDWYCQACKIRWVPMEQEPDDEEAGG